MSGCFPDLPRYVRQRNNEWQGADHENGPWRPIPAPQSGLPWMKPAATEESSAPQPTPLSPAAQAIWDAWNDAYEAQGPLEGMDQPLAAALRAAVDQVVPEEPENEGFDGDNHDDKAEWLQWSQRTHTRRELLAIAAELEGVDG
jgi:hypothetical protein